jgi:hypothetical protein
MCVVSMVGDHYNDKWKDLLKPLGPNPNPYQGINNDPFINLPPLATKQDVENLRKEVLEMKEWLKRAIKYDEINNQPHCENEEKIALLKKVAEMVGVDLSDILK